MRHLPFTRHFFIDGRYHGASPAGYRYGPDRDLPPESYSFCCPHCGEQWAKAPVAYGTGTPLRWNHLTHTCRKCKDTHPSRFMIPGSLWISFDPSFTESFSEEVLRREMDLHWQAFDNDWN